MISVIIPIYNAEKYLRRCLDSVLNQTYSDWECVMVDDGSKDSSGKICDEYAAKDPRFKVIHQRNGGVSAARNAALAVVIGEWVTFSDSDDELTPNALSDFAEATNRYPNAKILRGGHRTLTARGRSKDRAPQEWLCTNNHSEALRIAEDTFCSGFMWSTCFHRDILQGETFENDITWCEDHIFTYRCMLKAKEIAFVPSTVYIYYLDDTYPLGFGKGLSFKPIDFNMAMRSAEEQRKVKLALAGTDSSLQRQIEAQYRGTVNLAFYYAHSQYSLFKVIGLSKSYDFVTTKQVLRSWLGYHKTKLVHQIKIILKLY